MVKLFTLVGLVRGGLVNVSSHEKQILFQKLGANNHFDKVNSNMTPSLHLISISSFRNIIKE